VEVVDPRTLRPMDTSTVIESVKKTHHAVVLEAGAGFAGLGAEIATLITERAFDYLDSQVVRVTGANAPMPYAKNLERAKTPDKARIIAGIKQALAV
ncbi:MAG TPA: transketolase C-terminal domain-containing protein, partial [Candidatus Methylomirabilis sp.]|nr:transketolase C-terminal domain-containing protein [Candidatus Methylomirabilis sp.]